MTSLTAGAKVRASVINGALPLYGRVTSDTTVTSSTTLVAATGFAIALEASSIYVADGYMAYTAGATGDLKVAWTGPTGITGHWCLYGLSTASTGSIGDIDARRQTAYGTGTTQAIGGSDAFSSALACLPRLTSSPTPPRVTWAWSSRRTPARLPPRSCASGRGSGR